MKTIKRTNETASQTNGLVKNYSEFINEQNTPLTYHKILFEFETKFKHYVNLCVEGKYEEASREYEKALKHLDNELREYASQQTGKYIICES